VENLVILKIEMGMLYAGPRPEISILQLVLSEDRR